MKEVSCILCQTASRDVAITENGFAGVKCQHCNLIYISPRPSAAEVTHLYTHEHAVLYADAQLQFGWFNRMAAGRTLSKIAGYKKNGSILELGPGGGYFLSEARTCGYEPYAIELNPIEHRWISERLHIPCENVALSNKSFDGRKFDIVYHKDVLSHLSDPISVFRSINSVLKDDGVLVFETGNIGDVSPKYYQWFSQFLYPDHLFFFGERSLRMLLEQTGFRCIRIYRENIMLQLLLQKVLWKAKESLKDKKTAEDITSSGHGLDAKDGGLSLKRRMRLLYRYVGHYLIRCGAVLPKAGRPLKLLVVAEKG